MRAQESMMSYDLEICDNLLHDCNFNFKTQLGHNPLTTTRMEVKTSTDMTQLIALYRQVHRNDNDKIVKKIHVQKHYQVT